MKAMFILFFKKKKLKKELIRLFCEDAKEFSGVYNGIYLICHRQNKNNLKALDKFYKKLKSLSGYDELIRLLDNLLPTEAQSKKNLERLAKIIMLAVEKAGITHSKTDEIVTLTIENLNHYNEWNSERLYEDDKIKIISPAWFQESKLLEQGYCVLEEQGE